MLYFSTIKHLRDESESPNMIWNDFNVFTKATSEVGEKHLYIHTVVNTHQSSHPGGCGRLVSGYAVNFAFEKTKNIEFGFAAQNLVRGSKSN